MTNGGNYADTAQAYTTVVNVIDHPTVVIPVTRADKSIDKFNSKYTPIGEVDRKNWEACETSISRNLEIYQ